MAQPRTPTRRRGTLRNWIAGGAILAVAATVAVVASGFDAQETPREDPSVWVARADGQYARVNTETAEIDTVRLVDNPSTIVQSGGIHLLLTQGLGRAWKIDPAAPVDLQEQAAGDQQTSEQGGSAAASGGDAERAIRTPDGTREVLSGSANILFLTEAGDAYVADIVPGSGVSTADLGAMLLLDPFAKERANAAESEGSAAGGDGTDGEESGAENAGAAGSTVPRFTVSAAAIDGRDLVALYSASTREVRWFDGVTDTFTGDASSVPDEVPDTDVQLAIVNKRWVIFDPESGGLWRQNGPATTLEVTGEARLQGSAVGEGDTAVYVADEQGLWEIAPDGAAERVANAEGSPARPQQVAQEMTAAWVSTTSASMWTSEAGSTELQFDESASSLSEVAPEIRSNGSRAVLSETRSGMLWTLPEGVLIPLEQWELVDPPKQREGEVVAQDVTEPEPPVAVADTFGVRADEPVMLPVLLNDYDPNRRDVLTVVSDGLGEGLSPDFGRLSLLSDGQGLTIQPSPTASGSTTFSYSITDGVSVSAPATVTLTVIDDSVNSAPVWCPVVGCQRSWPDPEITPGGTLVLPLLDGWVDPEGDPILLTKAVVTDPTAPVRALVTADGKLAVRHTDANAAESDVVISVRVEDSRGAWAERDLTLRVRTGAAIDFPPIAATVKAGEPTTLRPLERITGGSGSFQLVDAAVQQGALNVVVDHAAGTLSVTAPAAGSATLSVMVRDIVTGQETTGVIRTTAVDARGAFAVPPLRAFVRPMADTTIDVLASLPGANTRALSVQSATVKDGQLRADVIEHSSIRISGSTPDGNPGRIGSIDVVITEGDVAVTGRVTVFQVADTTGSPVIAVGDTATVRAGSVVDIPVLDNDVAPPGERLVLNPVIGAPGIEGELAFASGSRVRYLAPQQPGTYTLTYTTYGASSPEQSDVGHVTVTVIGDGANRAPQPRTLTVRVAPGESVSTTVPLSGIDPDGDRARLVSVESPSDPKLTTSMVSRTNVIEVTASTQAERGTQLVPYLVRDSFGGEANGMLRIIVTDPDAGGGAPVVYSDYVRIVRGSPEAATVKPLDNDLDPTGGDLELVSVEPNVPGGSLSPQYAEIAARLDTSSLDSGIVRIMGGDEVGTFSLKYTVRSLESTSTADGLIVVQVSDRIGLQAPTVTDTVLSVRDRAEFASRGVDVVTDHVRWAAGDIDTLKLSLWGSAAGNYSVDGTFIKGSYRAEGDLIPFKLSGQDASGADVESYGFLHVPPLDELRLNLTANFAPLTVKENGTLDVNVNDIVELGSGDRIEIQSGNFSTQREQASCAATGETTFRYNAGREAPWTDSCTIRVRLVEQNTYTVLSVPISIIPDAPVVQLNALTRTIAPGETQTIELTDMVGWQGGREGNIQSLIWQIAPIGGAFEATVSGSTVQVLARADAVPGSQQLSTVNVSGAGESQAVLTLRVGEAAPDVPRGATVSLNCTVGASCGTTLVNRAGEYDPFAGKPGSGLHVVSVDGDSCAYGTLQASGDSVAVSWPDSRGPGGQCTVSFTVRDGQNRTGTGTIVFDAQGVPRAPASIAQIGYGPDSVQLEVVLGNASNAHPSVSGIVIDMDGTRVAANCTPAGGVYRCDVGGLDVGVAHTFTARAVNAVGESEPTPNSVSAWAYRGPLAPTVKVTQLSAESSTSGTIRFEMTPGDTTTGGYQVSVAGQSQNVSLGQSAQFSGVPVGSAQWQAVPVSSVPIPSGGSANGDAATGTFAVQGRPIVSLAASPTPGSNDVQITVVVNGNGDDAVTHGYQTAIGLGAGLSCNPGQISAGEGTFNYVETGQRYRWMRIVACAENKWGPSEVVDKRVRVYGEPTPPQVVSGYVVNTTPNANGDYVLQTAPVVNAAGSFELQYIVQGVELPLGAPFPTSLDPSQLVNAQVQQCADGECSRAETIPGNVPATVSVSLPTCVDPNNPEAVRTGISAPARHVDYSKIFYDDATQTLTITWVQNQLFGALSPLTAVIPACAPQPPNTGTDPPIETPPGN